ncbi:MAG TPA: cytochrome c [Longimicrobiales bacterium]|nr:cytochrome c [Longimicrobiales bacterium]
MSRRHRSGAAAAALALAACGLLACGPSGDASGGASGATDGSGIGSFAAGTPEGLPSHAPARFGFGAEASAARIARWDIDVKPDGEGLPPGRGSVAEGRQVYMTYCVACHGPTGTEGPNDRLVGAEPWGEWPGSLTVGGYWPYATTLYDYVRKAMPQLTPGVLSADQTYAVIAYILHLNGIVPEDAVMDPETLAAVGMPARDRFVPDDRAGGAGPPR